MVDWKERIRAAAIVNAALIKEKYPKGVLIPLTIEDSRVTPLTAEDSRVIPLTTEHYK